MSERYARLEVGEIQEYEFQRGVVTAIDRERGLISYRKILVLDPPKTINPEGQSRAELEEDYIDFYTDYGVDGIDGVFEEDYIDFEELKTEQLAQIAPGAFVHCHFIFTGAILPDLDGSLCLGKLGNYEYCVEPNGITPSEVDDYLNRLAEQRITEYEERLRNFSQS